MAAPAAVAIAPKVRNVWVAVAMQVVRRIALAKPAVRMAAVGCAVSALQGWNVICWANAYSRSNVRPTARVSSAATTAAVESAEAARGPVQRSSALESRVPALERVVATRCRSKARAAAVPGINRVRVLPLYRSLCCLACGYLGGFFAVVGHPAASILKEAHTANHLLVV
jgi:hypothetical protein